MTETAVRLVILFASLSGWLLLMRQTLRILFAVAVPVLPAFLICMLYFSDFVSAMQLVSYFLAGVGVLLAMFFVWQAWRAGFQFAKNENCASGAVVLLLLSLVLYVLNAQGQYTSWDEFSHWGAAIRAIFAANPFHFYDNPLNFQTYPPGLAFILALLVAGLPGLTVYLVGNIRHSRYSWSK